MENNDVEVMKRVEGGYLTNAANNEPQVATSSKQRWGWQCKGNGNILPLPSYFERVFLVFFYTEFNANHKKVSSSIF